MSLRLHVVAAAVLAHVAAAQDPIVASGAAARAVSSSGSLPFEIRTPFDRLFDVDDDGPRASTTPPSSAPRGGSPPILGDVPVLSSLFAAKSAALPPREAWLKRELSRAVGTPLGVRFEETRLRSYDGDHPETTSTRREVVVSGPADARKRTEEVLAALAAAKDRSLMISAVIATRRRPAGDPPEEKIDALSLDDAERLVARLVRRDGARGEPDVDVLSAPKVITRHGSPALITIGNDLSYIGGHDLQFVDDDSVVVDPRIAVMHEGITLEALPLVRATGDAAEIRIRLEISHVKRPVKKLKARLPFGDLEVERPELATLKWESAVSVPAAGGAFRASGLKWTDPKSGEPTLGEILVSVKFVDAPPQEVAAPVFTGADPSVIILDARDREDLRGAAAGGAIEVLRAEQVVGTWTIERAAEGMIVLRRVSGDAPGPGAALRLRGAAAGK